MSNNITFKMLRRVGAPLAFQETSDPRASMNGMDIDPTVIKAALVNGYLYAPWK